MPFNPHDIKKRSRELLEKLQAGSLRDKLSVVWHRQWEIIVAAVAAVIVGILLLLIR